MLLDNQSSEAIDEYLDTGVPTHRALAEAAVWLDIAMEQRSIHVDEIAFLVDRIRKGLERRAQENS